MHLPEPVTAVAAAFLDEVDRRLPDRVTGLFIHGSLCWGEFLPGSDVDFVAMWDGLPEEEDLRELESAHRASQARHPAPTFDGFHCVASDLGAAPTAVGTRPTFYEGSFEAAGTIDINLVTWHELAERPIVVRGTVPPVHTDLTALLEFTRTNLNTYWRSAAEQVAEAGPEVIGKQDDAVAWLVLGAARLHHLLVTRTLTSKSGAGRYVAERLDSRWAEIGLEALRIRETPDHPTRYPDPGTRGRDMSDLLGWLIEDGTALTRDSVSPGDTESRPRREAD